MIKLHDLHTDYLIKKGKQINRNAGSLGEATVSEWIWVSFYRIKLLPLQTLVQYE